jgi:hypothetical protein
MSIIFCKICKCENEHTHKRDCAHGIEETHMSGSERYECIKCTNAIYSEEGMALGLKFVYDSVLVS